MKSRYGDISVELVEHVALLEICRPPHNFFDVQLIEDLAAALEMLDQEKQCRASVLAAQGSAFCAGADFNRDASVLDGANGRKSNPLYDAAVRIFDARKPVIAAIQGAATGGGLGLAVAADFRVCCAEARFTANFTGLGLHPGFGLSHTLPQLIGQQRANLMLYTSRRIKGDQAFEWGLADVFTTRERLREEALALAAEIAQNAPLALLSVRATLRDGLVDRVRAVTNHENREQLVLSQTDDFKEGVRAMTERRPGNFTGS
jgi:enoyl-CoA hydratase/carnithine racemase